MSHSNVYAFNHSNGVSIGLIPFISVTVDQTICFFADVSCTNSKFTIYNVVDKTYVDGVSIIPNLGNNVNVETTYPIQGSSSAEWDSSMAINMYVIKQNKTTCSDVIIGQQNYNYYSTENTTVNYFLGFGVGYDDVNETAEITIQVNKITIYNLNKSIEEEFEPDINGIFTINNHKYSNTTTGTLKVIPFSGSTTPDDSDTITMVATRTSDNNIRIIITNNTGQTYSNCRVTINNSSDTVLASKTNLDISSQISVDFSSIYLNAKTAHLYNGNTDTELANADIPLPVVDNTNPELDP